jgi:hypothetical protein
VFNRIGIGVGTPQRLSDLISEGESDVCLDKDLADETRSIELELSEEDSRGLLSYG